MRIGWYSNSPFIPSGYGQQSAQVLSRLKAAGHECAVMSNHGAQVQLDWQGIPIFPDGLKQYGVDIFGANLKAWGGVSIGLFDCWPLVGLAEQLRQLNLAWWVPVDHDPAPPGVVDFFSKTGSYAIAMSEFGRKALLAKGMPEEMVGYIPHAVDTKTLFTDRGRDSREAMGVPKDAHLTMMNAANRGRVPVRKAFGENLEALVRHLKKHPDAWAYIHTEPEGLSDGMHLPRYLQMIDAPMERIKWPEPIQFRNGIQADTLPFLYSAADVLLATSMGEGFGVPTIEAQACGTPVIVSDWAASSELCGPYGTKIGGQRSWDEFQGSFWIIPSINQITEALEDNYQKTKAGMIDRAAVRRFGERYDADLVFERDWVPMIELLSKRQVPGPGAAPNREQRRAAKKGK